MLKIETSIVDINNMADTEEKLEVSIQLGEEKAEISEEAKIEAEKLKTEANEYFKSEYCKMVKSYLIKCRYSLFVK